MSHVHSCTTTPPNPARSLSVGSPDRSVGSWKVFTRLYLVSSPTLAMEEQSTDVFYRKITEMQGNRGPGL